MGFYDTTAAGYQELYGQEQARKARAIMAYLQQHNLISEKTRLLDVGCGPAAATALFPGIKTGIDPSLQLLKQRADKSIRLVHGVAEKLPFPDSWFDIVISITAVHNFKNIEQGLREIRRVGTNLYVITVLKKSSERSMILGLIRKYFSVETILDDQTDEIVVLRRRRVD